MGISGADIAKNPRYLRFVRKKTTQFANACYSLSKRTIRVRDGSDFQPPD